MLKPRKLLQFAWLRLTYPLLATKQRALVWAHIRATPKSSTQDTLAIMIQEIIAKWERHGVQKAYSHRERLNRLREEIRTDAGLRSRKEEYADRNSDPKPRDGVRDIRSSTANAAQ